MQNEFNAIDAECNGRRNSSSVDREEEFGDGGSVSSVRVRMESRARVGCGSGSDGTGGGGSRVPTESNETVGEVTGGGESEEEVTGRRGGGRSVRRRGGDRVVPRGIDDSVREVRGATARGPRVHGWCFTINNYIAEDEERVRRLAGQEGSPCSYVVYQREVAPATGTPHLQGYAFFLSHQYLSAVRKVFRRSDGTFQASLVPARGSADQNIAYCTKEDSRDGGADAGPFEFGQRPVGQGKRTDLDDAVATAVATRSIAEVIAKHPSEFVRYGRGLHELISFYTAPRCAKTVVHWFYGRTGTGKSRLALEECERLLALEEREHIGCAPQFMPYHKMGSTKWWDGYCGQEYVVIDDYRCDLCPFHELLKLFDRYPMRVEVKGGSVQFVAKRIYITCPKSPRDMWSQRTEEDLGQLLRRVEVVRDFNLFPYDPEDPDLINNDAPNAAELSVSAPPAAIVNTFNL